MIFKNPLKYKLIYVFTIDDVNHKGCLKIGETSINSLNIEELRPNSKKLNEFAKKRINQYTQTAGISYQLLYTELALYEKDNKLIYFSDRDIHNILINSGINKKIFDTEKKANEWFITDLETIKNSIRAIKENRRSLNNNEITENKTPIIFRPEQKEAIEKTKKQFKKSNSMLWNAKMRFGKTLSALQLIKDMNLKKTIIMTHRPVVNSSWYDDFKKIFYDEVDISYSSKNEGESISNLEKQNNKYVYFCSIQDLRGSEIVGGNFDKNNDVFKINWDLIIIDEAHEGTQTELGKNVFHELKKNDTKVLQLSGTPFNLLDDFNEDEIYTWDYVMEQKAKKEYEKTNFDYLNPYSSLPRLNIYTYNLGKLLNRFKDEEFAFNFREFFRVNKEEKFIYESDILSFLNLISKDDKESNYPFSKEEYRKNFCHSLWILPGVKEAKALSNLLKAHEVFSIFKIINVAGDGDEEEEREEALSKVQNAIGENPDTTYTITLSCGRLTTGVSIPAWTAVFMLSGSFNTSASSYMQTIFRVQTPAIINARIKEECFVFDFAPDRTLKVIAETAKISAKAGKTTNDDRKIMGEFLNFCSIISIEGTNMKYYDVNSMMEQLKKVYVEKVVNNGFEDTYLYNNDPLMQLTYIDLKEFDNLKKIIGTTKAISKTNDIDINNQGFTNEEYKILESINKKNKKEFSEEEKKLLEEKKEKKKQKDTAISILRGISIRMPLLIYGAEIDNEDEELNIDNFSELIDDKSWEEFMPQGVTKEEFNKFKKYYEPDIFRSAGKCIRSMVKSTDNLDIEDRIQRITSIFSTFRNPDKETVLTPWKVVNMHIGDCIGGFIFFDEKMEKTLEKPRYAYQGEVTNNVFSSNSHILEINSKSGLYPLYMTYNIYRTIIDEEHKKNPNITIEEKNIIWDRILKKNIFVICKTPMAKSITRRTLIGFRKADLNIRYFEDLINQITNKSSNFIEKIKQGKNYWKTNEDNNMKFNAIVGNPPYQVMDGGAGASAKPIYHQFVEIAKKINPDYISMIMPSRWYAGGKGLDEFRESMLNDKNISKIIDFVNAKDCFPNTSISGGVNFFLWEKNYKGECEFTNIHNNLKETKLRKLNEFNIFIRYNKAVSILNKVLNKSKNSISSIVSTRNPFGLSSNERGKSNVFKDCIILYSSEGKSYIDKVINDLYLNYYKVMISKVTSEHAGEPDKNGMFRVLSRMEIIKKYEACTDSYLIIGKFDNINEANNLFFYLKTKFLRFLLLQSLSSINLSKDKFQFVPLQDFSNKSDINWDSFIPDIDNQLYRKYELAEEEINFIESMIKPMI